MSSALGRTEIIYTDRNLSLLSLNSEDSFDVVQFCLKGAPQFLSTLRFDSSKEKTDFFKSLNKFSFPFSYQSNELLGIAVKKSNIQQAGEFESNMLIDDRVILGFIRLLVLENNEAYIDMLVICEEFQSQGFGSKAVSLVEHWLYFKKNIKRILIGVEEQNLAAKEFFWPSLYYQATGRRYQLLRLGGVQNIFEMHKFPEG